MNQFVRELGWTTGSSLTRVAWVALPLGTLLSFVVTPYMVLASLAYLFMLCGIWFRHERVTHVRLMGAAIFIDISLVAILELQRSAVGTALSFTLNSAQMAHIAFSLLAVLLYGPVAYLGFKRYKNQATANQKKWHWRLGLTTFVLRTLGFLFMFAMLKS